MESLEEEIKDALKRSGYLLENRVLEKFINYNFNAESNYYFLDSKTSKFREVDIFATKRVDAYSIDKTLPIELNISFVVECINAPFPLGLFENLGSDRGDNLGWTYHIINGDARLKESLSLSLFSLLEKKESNKTLASRQYCGFRRKKSNQNKKGELMANHPEDFHNNLNKFIDALAFQQNEIKSLWEGRQPQILRLDILFPLIVLTDKIFLIKQNPNLTIEKKMHHRFMINKGSSNFNIDIIQEEYIDSFLEYKLNEINDLVKDLFRDLKK